MLDAYAFYDMFLHGTLYRHSTIIIPRNATYTQPSTAVISKLLFWDPSHVKNVA
jgi:hypothetical protein